MTFRSCLVAAVLTLSVVLPAAAQQPPEPPPAEAAPIIIPPASIGLFAGPEELQRALDESALPHSVPELLTELAKRANEIHELIASGSLGQVWVSAMGTKTVALVLEPQTTALPEHPRAAATMAIKEIVTAAWDLDSFGELGDKPKVEEAYTRLASAVSALKAAYEPR